MLLFLYLSLASFLLGGANGCPEPHERPVQFPKGFFRARINDNFNETTQLNKRYVMIKPGDGSGGVPTVGDNTNGRLWPGGLIRACIDPTLSDVLRAEAVVALEDGMEIWHIAGVPRNIWTLDILTPTQCEAAGVRGPTRDYLWVRWAGRNGDNWNVPSANLGNLNSGSLFFFQTKAYFAANRGLLEVLGQKYDFRVVHAHEMGHVMGLIHEHQHPRAWSRQLHGGIASNADAILELDCEALSQYSACFASAKTHNPAASDASIRDSLQNSVCAYLIVARGRSCAGWDQGDPRNTNPVYLRDAGKYLP